MHRQTSRRDDKLQLTKRQAAALLTASALVFTGGATSFAWALGDAQTARQTQQPATQPGENPAAAEQDERPQAGKPQADELQASEQPENEQQTDGQRGVIAPGALDDGEQPTADSGTQETPKGAQAETEAPSTDKPAASPTAPKAKKKEKAKEQAARQPASKAAKTAPKTKTVRYRLVKHEKSVAVRKDTADGFEITWSKCPACGKKHKQSFTEKVRIN